MELRLSVSREDAITVIHVDGRLAASGMRDLDETITGVPGAMIIDLTNLLSADDAGIVALRVLSERGIQLRGASPYVALLLRGDRSRRVRP